FVAVFGFIVAVMGSHIAGAGSPAFKSVHAHILVVGWLSVFAWGMYYKVFQVKAKKLMNWQGWTGMIGVIGLTVGMWLEFVRPCGDSKASILPVYIGGGVVVLVSFFLFAIATFIAEDKKASMF